MNIFKYVKKAITFALVVFGLSWALQSPSFAAGLEGTWKLTSLGDSSVPSEVLTSFFQTSPAQLLDQDKHRSGGQEGSVLHPS